MPGRGANTDPRITIMRSAARKASGKFSLPVVGVTIIDEAADQEAAEFYLLSGAAERQAIARL
jgi:hypothetical protein